jgi:hypothetical protein
MKFQGKSKRLCDIFPYFKACEWKTSILDKYNSESPIPRLETLLSDHSPHRLTFRSCKAFSFTSFNGIFFKVSKLALETNEIQVLQILVPSALIRYHCS